MKNAPLNPKLPGRYGRMSRTEMDAATASLARPIPLRATRAMTPAERQQWQRAKRRPGRPRRGKGARVISLTVEHSLLEKADRAAKRAGISRAALFEMGLQAILANPRKLAG
jgi:hypothetical protein